jgi:hypothetical protein
MQKPFDDLGLIYANQQARAFSLSRSLCPLSSPLFIRGFMLSSLAEDLDHLMDKEAESYFWLASFPKRGKKRILYEEDELHWIGWIYRYWAYTRGYSSAQLYRAISGSEIRPFFGPYHSQDPEKAVSLLEESHPVLAKDDFLVVRKVFSSPSKK